MNTQAITQSDAKALQARISELEAKLRDREALLYNKEQQLQQLQVQIGQLQNSQYGSSSERMLTPDQMEWDFFNEAELLAALE